MSFPIQVISESQTLKIKEHDLRGREESRQIVDAEKVIDELGQVPFDFERGLLLQVHLIILSDHEHLLFIRLPALCSDSRGLENLLLEIYRFYGAYLSNEEVADSSIQYADFSEWQNQSFEAMDVSRDGREFWSRSELSTGWVSTLPIEKKGGSNIGFQPEVISIVLASDLVEQLEDLSRKFDVSPSVFLLTCWQVLLWKLTAESNIIVGAAFDGRYYEELQDALGLFVKYLPLHCRLNSDDLFEVALRSAQRAWQEAALWQDYFAPEHLGYVFPQSSGPVFYVPLAFDFQVAPAPLRLAGLQFSLLSQRICLDRFQLKLSCWRHSDGLQAEFHF